MIGRTFLSTAVVVAMLTVTIPARAQDDGVAVRNAASSSHATATLDEYRIGPEDNLQISVWKNEAMSRTIPVRPDGKISLPLLNDVQAAGLTPLELRDVLMKKLVDYIPNPEVSVIVAEVRSFKVSVIGEVVRPMRYELRSWTTVLDVIALAGGFTQYAARSQVVILRPNGNTMTRVPFNYNKLVSRRDGLLDKIVTSGGEQENFYLRNGDIVLVP